MSYQFTKTTLEARRKIFSPFRVNHPSKEMMIAFKLLVLAAAFGAGLAANRFQDGNLFEKKNGGKARVSGKVNIQKEHLPLLAANDATGSNWKNAAKDWKITEVRLVFLEGKVHTAIRLIFENRQSLIWEYNADDWFSRMYEVIKGYYAVSFPDGNKIGHVDNPKELTKDGLKTEAMTLGRLVDCVDATDLPNKIGQCTVFSVKVLRFAAGDCQCKQCASDPTSLVSPIETEAAKAKIVGDTAGFTKFKGFVKTRLDSTDNLWWFVRQALSITGAKDAAKAVGAFCSQMNSLLNVACNEADFKFIADLLSEEKVTKFLQQLEQHKNQE